MKRSEMVQKVFDLIRTTKLISVEDDLKCAEKVVALMEHSGMKPPLKTRCPVLLTDKHSWEPENEQNPRT